RCRCYPARVARGRRRRGGAGAGGGAARPGRGAGRRARWRRRVTAFLAALARLGPQLADHVLLSAAALVLGIVLALPLAVWAGRSPGVARVVLGLASLVQTIPALALLALFFPVLLA